MQTRKKVQSLGPKTARLMIVGEAPGKEEEAAGVCFQGRAGVQMTRMLEECNISRTECFLTNVARYRPPRNDVNQFFETAKGRAQSKGFTFGMKRYYGPEIAEGLAELEEEIDQVRPNIILAFGNTALWALTGETGITNWRGSQLTSREIKGRTYKVVPTFHPSAILRQWSWRYLALHDIRQRVYPFLDDPGPWVKPDYKFTIRPQFSDVMAWLNKYERWLEEGPLEVAGDLETRRGHITCLGLAHNTTTAICIPFTSVHQPEGYWSLEEETAIVLKLREVMTHKNFRGIGQNWLYDAQYIAKHWGFEMNLHADTMINHHVCWAGLKKSLDFQSSLYCSFHEFWKDEGKEWNPKTMPEEQYWTYNCKDAVITWECKQAIHASIEKLGLQKPRDIQQRLFQPVLHMMLRGVKVRKKVRDSLFNQVLEEIGKRESVVQKLLGHPINVQSPKQLSDLFYGDFAQKPVKKRRAAGVFTPSTDEEALEVIGKREPLLLPLCGALNDQRKLKSALAVINQKVDRDGRMRCSYVIPGTETYRFASQKDAFGFGTNLQNITKGNEKDALQEDNWKLIIPNIRRVLGPDEGYVLVGVDLPQADAQVVAWEADDEELKAIFRDPTADLHTENAKTIFGGCTGSGDPRRQRAKAGVHAANYGVTAPTLAKALGITVREAQRFLDTWFAAHPKIRAWQDDVEFQIMSRRYVTNAFGYRRYYFDRVDNLLKEALAWIPQSTVAIVTNLGIINVHENMRDSFPVLQVHDEGVYMVPKANMDEHLRQIRKHCTIAIPYEDPLIMPPGCEVSDVSWGEITEYQLQEAV